MALSDLRQVVSCLFFQIASPHLHFSNKSLAASNYVFIEINLPESTAGSVVGYIKTLPEESLAQVM